MHFRKKVVFFVCLFVCFYLNSIYSYSFLLYFTPIFPWNTGFFWLLFSSVFSQIRLHRKKVSQTIFHIFLVFSSIPCTLKKFCHFMLHFKSHLLPFFPFILRTCFPYKDRLLLNLFFLFFSQTRLHRKKASQMVFFLFLVGVSSITCSFVFNYQWSSSSTITSLLLHDFILLI